MKRLLFLIAAAVAGVSFAEQADHWTYNGSTISDGEWTFAATVKADTTEMTVNAHSGNPSVASELDFSKPVTDSAGVAYTIVTLNPQFNNDAAGKLISKLMLPAEGLKTISANAFNQCTALTEVSPYIPDSVTSIGANAFNQCPAKQELFLRGLTELTIQPFASCGITCVTFGPNLKKISGPNASPFSGSTSLTTVVFDPAMTGGYFEGQRCCGFYNMSSLTGTIDLSGFSDLTHLGLVGGDARDLGNTSISKVIVGPNLKKLDVNFFDQMGKLREIVFNTTPDDFEFTKGYNKPNKYMLGGIASTQPVIVRIHEADVDKWKHLAKDGVINADDSTFSEEFAGPNYAMRYLLTDGEPSGGGELGNWVYDNDEGVITHSLGWKFEASATVHALNIGTCLAAPDEVSVLDFTDTMTDKRGVTLNLIKVDPGLGNLPDFAKKVGELRLPNDGNLKIIGESAFGNMVNCTKVVNYIPDSVTSLGKNAFTKCPANQELFLRGLTELTVQPFGSCGITRVTFGPNLTKISGPNASPFAGSTSLTNVVFDPAMTSGSFDGQRYCGFNGLTSLKGTIDLSGFSDLTHLGTVGGDARDLGNTSISKVIVGSNLKKLDINFFDQMGKLEEIVFNTTPDNFTFTSNYTQAAKKYMLGGIPSTQPVVVRIHEADTNAWKHLAKDGIINADDSTFSEEFAGPNYAMRYLLTDGKPSGGGDLGDWVFDKSTGFVTNAVGWKFEAVQSVRSLNIGTCLAAPDGVSILDLTGTMTDAKGIPLTLNKVDSKLGDHPELAEKVGELWLPNDGSLKIIGENAFRGMINCTNVVNYIPDSVTTLGDHAFQGCPAKQELFLLGMAEIVNNPFVSCGITRVTFGPNLKKITPFYDSPFMNCTSLTNIVFDPAMTGGSFGGQRFCGFNGIASLVGTVDLSGFSDLTHLGNVGGSGRDFGGTSVSRIILGPNLEKFDYNFLDQMSHLEEVVFNTSPASFTFTKGLGANARIYSGNSSTRKITTYITKENREAWAPYVLYNGQPVDKVPPGKGVTWKPEYVTEGIDLSLRPVRVLDMVPGLMLLVK